MTTTGFYHTGLPPHLRVLRDEIEGYARGYGLDFYDTIFEVVDADDLNEIAAYGGFPTRYPHWSFGMAYNELSKSYSYGLSKIYEMVINNDPCYAYLMRCNHVVDQKLVMAHVYGHCDFFKHNAYFGHTSRKMMDEIANHGSRIRRYAERFGEDEVEAFLDRCMSMDDLIDIHSVAIRRRDEPHRHEFKPADAEEEHAEPVKFKSKPYLDGYVNPPEPHEEAKPEGPQAVRFPERPEKDVLWFLIEHAPLKGWQKDILSIVRDEAYYFYPQAQTKIMNEGWASYWHSTIMTQKVLEPTELVDYADHHSGTMATSGKRLNPYKVGLELLRDVEHRWDTGRFGAEWDACDDLEAKRNWDKQTGLGRKKIFEVRKVHNDITFIDTFLTPEFCVRHKLFSFNYQQPTKNYVIESREFEQVKRRLLFSLTNFGKPWIYVVNGNHRNRGELLLRHEFNGVELKLSEARDTLANVQYVWGRPVHLETVSDDKPTLLSFDGTDHSSQVIGAENDPRRSPAGKLADWTPAGPGRHALSHTDPDAGWAVAVSADRADTVGCLAWEVTATRTGPSPAGFSQRQWADRIAAKATGLLEPLKVHEVDATQDEAVLRSDGPSVAGDAVKYYEVRLHGTERATVRRYEASKSQSGRTQTPFAVTHEALAKLAGDMCG